MSLKCQADTLLILLHVFRPIRLAAGATGQQGMFTPHWHLIPPLAGPGVGVSPFIYLTCNSYLRFEID
jgi:hypothetical protein